MREEKTVELVDTSKLTSMELVDGAICQYKDLFFKKENFYNQIKDAKNQSNLSFREQLKEIKEELDTLRTNVQSLEDHKKLVNAAEETE